LWIKNTKCLTAETTYSFLLERKILPHLGIFHRHKKEEETKLEQNPAPHPNSDPQKTAAESESQAANQQEEAKTYLKAMPLRDLADLEEVRNQVKAGNIIILKITPLANKNIADVPKAVNELYSFAEEINGDIARLGEERIVICPPKIRIWREKKQAPTEPLPTAA
jgi:uncharacterized protein